MKVQVWCETCEGTGQVWCESPVDGGVFDCPDCDGKGFNPVEMTSTAPAQPLVEAPCVHLTQTEIKWCHELPDVFRALADYHAVQETMTDASDMPKSAEFHRARMAELRFAAAKIEEEWENA